MKLFKEKVQADQINASGNNGGDDGSGDNQQNTDYFYRMQEFSAMLRRRASKDYGRIKRGSIKTSRGAKELAKFIFTPNKYPRYEVPGKITINPHELFSGEGYSTFRKYAFWLMIFFPASILLLAPLYALYFAEVVLSVWISVPPRTLKQYENGRPQSYREKKLQEFGEYRRATREHKRAIKARKRMLKAKAVDTEAVTREVVDYSNKGGKNLVFDLNGGAGGATEA